MIYILGYVAIPLSVIIVLHVLAQLAHNQGVANSRITQYIGS